MHCLIAEGRGQHAAGAHCKHNTEERKALKLQHVFQLLQVLQIQLGGMVAMIKSHDAITSAG